MTSVSSGTERMRPFMPAKDFELSKRFYEALGFEKVLDSEVAIFNAGSGGFILQHYFQEDWAKNFMMQLMVDDLDRWWAHIESLDLSKRFGVPWSAGKRFADSTRAEPFSVRFQRPDTKAERLLFSQATGLSCTRTAFRNGGMPLASFTVRTDSSGLCLGSPTSRRRSWPARFWPRSMRSPVVCRRRMT